MIIEILYPSFGNLFGESSGYLYLERCVKLNFPQAEIVRTEINDRPAFADRDVDLVYMGGMTESQQEMSIAALKPFKSRIEQLIDAGTIFLAFSNSVELFLSYIQDGDRKIEGLGLFKEYSARYMMNRYNGIVLAEFEGMKLTAFKTQFSMIYGDNSSEYMCKILKGIGNNKDTQLEGLRRKNFMGTEMVGPLVILNSDFTVYLLKLLGAEKPALVEEEAARAAYAQRLKEFEDPARVVVNSH